MYSIGKRFLCFTILIACSIIASLLLIKFAPAKTNDMTENIDNFIETNTFVNTDIQASISTQSFESTLESYTQYINECQYAYSQNLLEGAKIYKVSVIFYVLPSYSNNIFSKDGIQTWLKNINYSDKNDSLYSVREYFQDISFNRVDFNIKAYALIYEESTSLHRKDEEADITLNIYPVNANNNKSSPFWPSCAGDTIKLSNDAGISTICHEMLHTFGCKDLYSRDAENPLSMIEHVPVWVGQWDIMAMHALGAQFPLVYNMAHVSYMTRSNYYDSKKSNIEILPSSAKVNLKATSYANASDTIAIRINASDLGYESPNIFFMIEYRKPNGRKDLYTPTQKDSLIVYRVNENQYGNLIAKSQNQTFVYLFKKYNIEQDTFAMLEEGTTFGSEKDQDYNTIIMPNGKNTKIVIKNIKFNNDNSCSFEVVMPSASNEIVFSGTLQDKQTPIANCNILNGEEVIATTDVNGVFDVKLGAPTKLRFIKDDVLIKEYYVAQNQKSVMLNSDSNVCKLNIKNNISQVGISINGVEKTYYSTTVELFLNVGDKVKITTAEYKNYEFTYGGQKEIQITLSEHDQPNIIEKTIDKISTNAKTAIDSFVDSINTLERMFKNYF